MSDISNLIYLGEHVRELDRIAIEEFNIPSFDLMQRAAQAAFEVLRSTWPAAKKVIILVGNGNNGGDGYVIAALALDVNLEVQLIQVGDHSKLSGDAKKAHDLFLGKGGECEKFNDKPFLACDVIVDAMLGTGLTRQVSGQYANAINYVNQHAAPAISIDIASGLNANTGLPMGCAVKACKTITFVGQKLGLYTSAGREYSGKIIFDNLEIPQQVYQSMPSNCKSIELSEMHAALGARKVNAHKGDFGHVLVIGGNDGMAGSVMLAAEAAARTGAGLISVATIPQHATAALHACKEVMVHGVNDLDVLNDLLKQCSVVAIGPGLGKDDWAKHLFARVLEFDLPMVVDADALNLLAAEPMQKDSWVLTPHPGEAARLLNCSTKEIQQDRLNSVQQLQKRYSGVCVLKGSGTLIASAGSASVCIAGNPGMASGGMGDVLTGIIAGLLAQGLSSYDAARFGVQLHAQSADVAAEDGMRGMLASDLFQPLRKLVNQ
ncbi:MAG: NAD(P)H-hydrate dehydratase [Pseudomonadota bacterium]